MFLLIVFNLKTEREIPEKGKNKITNKKKKLKKEN